MFTYSKSKRSIKKEQSRNFNIMNSKESSLPVKAETESSLLFGKNGDE